VMPSGYSDGRVERGAIVPAGRLAVWLRGEFMGCVGPFERVPRNGRWGAVVGGLSDEIGVVQGLAREGG